jgi:hypothetical protein
MPDLLDFNPNRDLGFTTDRPRTFDPARDLSFKPDRDLLFHTDRDLGFGKRGPVFRGFVCPVCGSAVTEDQPRCDQCGAVFDARAPGAPTPPRGPPVRTPTAPPPFVPPPPVIPPPTHLPPPPPDAARWGRVDSRNCMYCGASLAQTAAFCWNCGSRVAMAARIPP